MIVSTNGSVLRLFVWQYKNIALFGGLATVVTAAHMLGASWLKLPTMPLAVVGAALGIFVSFRTNSCYDRWWEGRKLWGRMINTSRHFGIEAHQYLGAADSELVDRLVRRHIAYVHTLRCVLRGQNPLEDEELVSYLQQGDRERLDGSTNPTLALLNRQLEELTKANVDGKLDNFRMQSFDESIRHLLDIQGGCERIKKTPLPVIYALASSRMIQWFSALLPLALVEDLGWVSIPVVLLVIFGFQLMSEAGRVLEDPFTMFYNGLPLSDMSRTITRNLLETVSADDIPGPFPRKAPTIVM